MSKNLSATGKGEFIFSGDLFGERFKGLRGDRGLGYGETQAKMNFRNLYGNPVRSVKAVNNTPADQWS